jgi:hypothetical protein
MQEFIFLWSWRNEEHIGKLHVEMGEAEHVVRHAVAPYPRADADGKWLVWGATEHGRFLQIIFVLVSFEDVHAHEFQRLELHTRAALEDGEQAVRIIYARPDRERGATAAAAEATVMKKPRVRKKSWGAMTPAELAEATKEFDHPLPASRFKPLTKAQRLRWERAKRAGSRGREIVSGLHLNPQLLSEAEEYAKRMKISFHELIEPGIRKVVRTKRS